MSHSMLSGLKLENIGAIAYWMWNLGCLSIKRLILNCKEQKPACFSRDSWLGEYMDLLNMESASNLLVELARRQ